MNVTSNIIMVGLVDTAIFASGLTLGYVLGRIGYTQLKAEIQTIKDLLSK